MTLNISNNDRLISTSMFLSIRRHNVHQLARSLYNMQRKVLFNKKPLIYVSKQTINQTETTVEVVDRLNLVQYALPNVIYIWPSIISYTLEVLNFCDINISFHTRATKATCPSRSHKAVTRVSETSSASRFEFSLFIGAIYLISWSVWHLVSMLRWKLYDYLCIK